LQQARRKQQSQRGPLRSATPFLSYHSIPSYFSPIFPNYHFYFCSSSWAYR